MTPKRNKLRYTPPTPGRVLAATLGTLPVSVLLAAAIDRCLPAPAPIAFGVAYLAWLPIWLGLVCWVACRTSARRA